MLAISGDKTNMAVKVAGTFGTASAAGAGDKYIGLLTHSLNESVLAARAQGSGSYMPSGFTRGNIKPTLTATGDAHFNSAFGKFLSQFMGTDTVSGEITPSQGDYLHTITWNDTRFSKYLTIPYESSSTTVHEFPSCAVQSINIRTTSVPGYLEFIAELVANDFVLSTAVNTNAVLAAATITDTEIIAPAFDDIFYIGLQSGGTLSSSDKLPILSYDLKLSQAIESANEIKGSTGNGSPIITGPLEGELTIVLKELADHTYYTYWANETALKCRFGADGSLVGSTSPRSFQAYIPRMQLIKAPKYEIQSDGMNNVTYTFSISKASSNPTGMSSTLPYFTLLNALSTGYLA